MLSKNKIKYIHALELKKNRKATQSFVAEGSKSVCELLEKFPCSLLIATKEWLLNHPDCKALEIIEVTREELEKASFLKTPQEVLGIFEQPQYILNPQVIQNSLCLGLDDIQDPGNLGTIIRLADWFGIEDIFCSPNTVDAYNPKTVQATMGAISRVRIYYTSLQEILTQTNDIPVYGTFLNGRNIYQEKLTTNGLIIMGNEGNGISKEIELFINKRLYIPSFPQERETSESLNVAMATGIICAEFRRQAMVTE